MEPRSEGPDDQRMDSMVKDSYQVTVDNAATKTKAIVYIAKEAVPPEFNTYLYIAESKESLDDMIKAGTIKDKGVILVGEGLQRTAYFIKNGALVTRMNIDESDDKKDVPVPVTSSIQIAEEQELTWSPAYYPGSRGKSSDSSEIESTIDNAIKAAGRPAPLPLKRERDFPRDHFLQKASMALVAAQGSTSVTRYYVAAMTHNSKDNYDLFFTSPSARLTSQHHSFSVSDPIKNIKASKVTTGKVNLERGEERQAELEKKAKEFSALRQQAVPEKKQIPLEVEEKAPSVAISPLIEENIETREAKAKADLEDAKRFFNLSQKELDLFETASADFIQKMQQCNKTISDLKTAVENKSNFSDEPTELADRLEKNTREEKEKLSNLIAVTQKEIGTEIHVNLPQMKEEKNQDFKKDLLKKYVEAKQAILSDALICNLMKNAIRDTLLKCKDKQIILDTLQEHKMLKNAEDIIFNYPLDKTQFVTAINAVFDKLHTLIGAEHPYAIALKSALQTHLGESVQHKTEFFVFKKDKLEIDEKTLQQSREIVISGFKETILIKRKDGAVTLDEIQKKTASQVADLQQAQAKYLIALNKERDDFAKITEYRTTLSEKGEDTLTKINTLLRQAEAKRREADALLEQARTYEFSGVPHERSAWGKALAFHKQVESSIQELVTLRDKFSDEAKLSSTKASSKNITVDECDGFVQEMEKIAAVAMSSSTEKLTAVTQTTSRIDNVIQTVKIENAQQKIFDSLKIILMADGQIDYWNDQRKIGGTQIKDERGETQKVPTGIGKMIQTLRAPLFLKEGEIADIQHLLESCGKEAEDRLSRRVFLGYGEKIGRQKGTSEIYGLIKDIKDSLDDAGKLEILLHRLEKSIAYTQYREKHIKQYQAVQSKQELR